MTEEEKQAKKAAKDAEKQAKKAARDAEKTKESIERIREYEEQANKANREADEARKKKEAVTGNRKEEVAEKILTAEEQRDREIERLHDFYEARLDNNNNISIELNNLKIINLLGRMGFYRYDQQDGSSEYVRIQDNKIRLVMDTNAIIDAFEDYVRELPDRKVSLLFGKDDNPGVVEKTIYSDMLLEKIYKNINYYFSQTLPRLRPRKDTIVKEITTVKDTPDAKYFFYNNVVLRITKDGIEEIDYENLGNRMTELGEDNGQYIWESNILNRDYEPTSGVGEFEQFIMYICGIASLPSELSQKRFNALRSIIGYLIHDSYECNLKAVILTDAVQDDGMPSGGTGKGILGKAIAHILNREESDHKYIVVPGKGFDTSKDTRYAMGDITTQTIHIEDAKTDINFEALYNDITDGATFRKLHHDPTYHKSKFIISTNTPISCMSESNIRRMIIFELDNFFNSHKTPEDVFKHRFFESKWSKEDWLQYDNFMVGCALCYMQNGIIDAGELNYSDNYLKSKLRPEFLEWIKNKLSIGIHSQAQCSYELEKLYSAFSSKYPDTFKVRNSFTSGLKMYLRVKKIPSCITRGTTDLLVLFPNEGTTVSEPIYK